MTQLTPYQRQQARELCTVLPTLRNRCVILGLLQTSRAMEEACKKIGWELAELEKESEVKVRIRPCKPMEEGPTDKWMTKFLDAHNGDPDKAQDTARTEFIVTRDNRRVTFWAEVSRRLAIMQAAI
jgi:hypothetical protein